MKKHIYRMILLGMLCAGIGGLLLGKGCCPGFAQEAPAGQETLVSLDYKDANLATVLKALSYSYDLNLVITKDVKGTVNVTLNDVTVDEALDAILKVNGYTFTRKGNLIYITPGPGTEGIDLVTKPIHLSYLTAADSQRLLSRILSAKGDIQTNEATNSLVVTDFPANISKIENLLKDIDTPPIQVLIEAKIVDIQAKAYENMGTTYTVTYDPAGAEKGLFDRKTNFDESAVATTTLAGPSSTLSGGQLTITTTMKGLQTSATIDALIQDNKAHLLASPSIATLNGKEARIIIGEKYPYKEKTQTTTGTTETTKFIDVGTTLKVTPLVSRDGWITMNVHPEVSSVSQQLDAGPRITTREADAAIRVKDGQTIIIGGLINKKDDQIKGGVPILRHIPILGLLFSKRSSDIEETELTVFITPRIIRTPRELGQQDVAFDEEIHLNIDRIGSLDLEEKLLEHAEHLKEAASPESSHKSREHRMQERLRTYQMVAEQFPDSPRSDYVFYQMGELQYSYFKNYQAAREMFGKIIKDFPKSEYYMKADKMLKKIDKAIEKS